MAAEKVAADRNQQPEPQNEHKDGEHVSHEIRKGEAPVKQHYHSPFILIS
jgi:hypothetical protein